MNAKSLNATDREWLRSLTFNKDGPPSARMTVGEEKRMIELIRAHGLPCTMEAWGYGFEIVIHDLPAKKRRSTDTSGSNFRVFKITYDRE